MKELLLKIAGVKTESAFYKKFPTKAAFFKAHPEAKQIIAQYQHEMENHVAENPQEQMIGGPEETMEQMANGGGIDNPGFKALPKSVQENIISNMAMGGKVEKMGDGGIPQRYKNMGFTHVGQKKQGDGQHKWKVLAKKGDKFKVVQGGWRGMQDFSQHHSEKRRERFWDRMGGKDSAKAHDPFSPLYWHKKLGKWSNGGIIPEMQELILPDYYNNYGIMQEGGMVDKPELYDFASGGTINIDPSHKGMFTKWAKERGMTVKEAAKHVLAHKDEYDSHVVKMANFANNFTGKKYAMGGNIEINPEHKGMFTAWAKKHNMSVKEAASHVLANKDKYDTHTIKMATFAHNFTGNKKSMGGEIFDMGGDVYAMGGGININPEHKGMFTDWANRHGMSVSEAAHHVMAHTDKYPTHIVRMANFALNSEGWKKADGGDIQVWDAFSNKVPIQAETYEGQPEQVVLPDGNIESVNAKESHEAMNDDEVTDVLPQGSHIQSSRNKLNPDEYANLLQMFSPETAENDIKMLEQVYKAKYGKKKNKELSPSDITEYAKKAYQKQSTPNNFDTNKLKDGNKEAFVNLGMTMNDLIKAGKEATMQGMAYGGMVNKYADGTEGNQGTSSWTNPLYNDYLAAQKSGVLKYDPAINKIRFNIPSNASYADKLKYAKLAEGIGLPSITQSKTPGYETFYGGITPNDYARYFMETSTGKQYTDKTPSKDILKDYFNELGFSASDKALENPKAIFESPEFQKVYSKYVERTPGMRESYGLPTLGDTPTLLGIQQLRGLKPGSQTPQTQTTVPATQGTPDQKLGEMGNYVPGVEAQTPAQQGRSRYYSGLLEKQLGYGLGANQAELNALLENRPIYQMETPDTYIRSQKTEVPVGNILYNIEKAQRNASNALANQTGDWSTLASNIANQGAAAMNQVGNTLSALNEKNLDLYNQQQAQEQSLLENNVGVRNWNLYNQQELANNKRNLFGLKAVKDAGLYSDYVKQLSQNKQLEDAYKLNLLSQMGAYPELYKTPYGQRISNKVLNTMGSYNNPYAGTILDYITNQI
jgi:hypothetical protein